MVHLHFVMLYFKKFAHVAREIPGILGMLTIFIEVTISKK